jgi:RNA-binding motif X-linked protein 2
MNPLTQIKNTQKISKQEILQGVPESASWHARYKHSAYIYAGGLPFDLTEGDVLTVFAQYGELVDVHNVKDRDTGKYRGFSFLAYEDQRSTVLAVDNLNGATVGGRTVRVEHVDNYKKKKAEVIPRLWPQILLENANSASNRSPACIQVEGKEESESEQDEEDESEELPAPPSQAAAVLPPPPSAGVRKLHLQCQASFCWAMFHVETCTSSMLTHSLCRWQKWHAVGCSRLNLFYAEWSSSSQAFSSIRTSAATQA